MIATEFTDWQKRPSTDLAKFPAAAPALKSLEMHVLDTYGGANLGIYGVRETRGGKALSSHAFGAAWDWSFRGLKRSVANTVIDFLIDNSAELGVQAVHDYQNCRIWRAGRGWKKQKPDRFGMGQAWADWLHVEVNERQWSDGRAVSTKLKGEARPVLRRGDKDAGTGKTWVADLQTTLKTKAGQPMTVDGWFGTQTEMAVRNVQAFFKAPVTGVCDAQTWRIVEVLNGLKP